MAVLISHLYESYFASLIPEFSQICLNLRKRPNSVKRTRRNVHKYLILVANSHRSKSQDFPDVVTFSRAFSASMTVFVALRFGTRNAVARRRDLEFRPLREPNGREFLSGVLIVATGDPRNVPVFASFCDRRRFADRDPCRDAL